jgi:hypothetical protein
MSCFERGFKATTHKDTWDSLGLGHCSLSANQAESGPEDDGTVPVDGFPPFHGSAEVKFNGFIANTHGVIRLLAKPFGDFRVGAVKDSGGFENTR